MSRDVEGIERVICDTLVAEVAARNAALASGEAAERGADTEAV